MENFCQMYKDKSLIWTVGKYNIIYCFQTKCNLSNDLAEDGQEQRDRIRICDHSIVRTQFDDDDTGFSHLKSVQPYKYRSLMHEQYRLMFQKHYHNINCYGSYKNMSVIPIKYWPMSLFIATCNKKIRKTYWPNS